MKNPTQRWEEGIEHHPESVRLYKELAQLDFENGDAFWFQSGGDGDNGEHLMYLLDMIFEGRAATERASGEKEGT